MELTLDQALQKGIEAHKAGKAQEADRYYTAILKANPNHPDANHNMGVLAVGVGKVQEALPFFKTALEANPSVSQFWLSYIDALIKLDRIDDAKAVLDQAKNNGAKGNGFDQIEKRLGPSNTSLDTRNSTEKSSPNILENLKLDQALKLAKTKFKDGANEEAKSIYQDILKKFPKNKKAIHGIKALSKKATENTSNTEDPPEGKKNSLIKLYNAGQFKKTLDGATRSLDQFPNSPFLLNICGAANFSLGFFDEAIQAYKKALAVNPNFPAAYNNMGNAFKEIGELRYAIESYKSALNLNPRYLEAYNNIGLALIDLEDSEGAIRFLKDGLKFFPKFAELHYNLANAYMKMRNFQKAIECFDNSLLLRPDHPDTYYNLGKIYRETGNQEMAIKNYKKAVEIKPNFYVDADHIIAALSGEIRHDMPIEYVEKLFDEHASSFEKILVKELNYKTPVIITKRIRNKFKNNRFNRVLDLGCGSGLFGESIRPFCNYLCGVDISEKIIYEAEKKKIYDTLCHADIIDYLQTNKSKFDLVVCLDVFVYLGNLDKIFPLLGMAGLPETIYTFSTEHSDTIQGYNLEKSGRFSHSQNYINKVCTDNNFELIDVWFEDLRKEQGKMLVGGHYVMRNKN